MERTESQPRPGAARACGRALAANSIAIGGRGLLYPALPKDAAPRSKVSAGLLLAAIVMMSIMLHWRSSHAQDDGHDDRIVGVVKLLPDVSVSVRAGPNPFSDVVFQTSAGGTFDWIGKSGDWYRIRAKDWEGYVYWDFVAESTRNKPREPVKEPDVTETRIRKQEVPAESAGDDVDTTAGERHSDDSNQSIVPARPATKPDGDTDGVEREEGTRIIRLLDEARTHLDAYRLTTPPGNNAFELYEQVLDLQPGNESAEAGMDAIADRYHVLAAASLRKGKPGKARQYLDRGLKIRPNHEDLSRLAGNLREQKAAPSESYQTGLDIFLGRNGRQIDDERAYRIFKQTASSDRPAAYTLLGYMTANGLGVPKDPQAAAGHFQAAAKHGDPQGKYYYGLCLVHGFGVPINTRQGSRLIMDAAAGGYTKAYRVLSVLYEHGVGVERSFLDSVKWGFKFSGSEISSVFNNLATGRRTRVLRIEELEAAYFDLD